MTAKSGTTEGDHTAQFPGSKTETGTEKNMATPMQKHAPLQHQDSSFNLSMHPTSPIKYAFTPMQMMNGQA